MISRDKKIFDENSEARQRMVEYGRLVEKLHIMVLNRPFKLLKIGKKTKGFDLITTQDPFEAGLIGWMCAKVFRTSLQLQIHTDFLSPYFAEESLLNKIRVKISKFLISRADFIRVVSERIKKSIIYSLKTHDLNIVVLPIFVDIKKIQETSIQIDLHKKYPQFDFIILIASRLAKEKNIALAIETMTDIVKKYPKTGLIIVGSGPEEKNLKSQIPARRCFASSDAGGSNLKINENIIMEEWTKDLISYCKTADLFLLTSNYEGYGRTLIEAAAAGCKIISSDVGIANEILPQENIFKIGDKNDLREKIEKAIKGEIKPIKTPRQQTKEQYLQEYKKSWENCL